MSKNQLEIITNKCFEEGTKILVEAKALFEKDSSEAAINTYFRKISNVKTLIITIHVGVSSLLVQVGTECITSNNDTTAILEIQKLLDKITTLSLSVNEFEVSLYQKLIEIEEKGKQANKIMTRNEILQNIIDRTKSGDLYWINKKGFFESTYNNDTTYSLRSRLIENSNNTYICLHIDGFRVNACYDKLVQELWDVIIDLTLEKTFVKTEESIEDFDIAEALINAVLTNKMNWVISTGGFRADTSTISYDISREFSGAYRLSHKELSGKYMTPIYPSQEKLARLYDIISKSIVKKDLSG